MLFISFPQLGKPHRGRGEHQRERDRNGGEPSCVTEMRPKMAHFGNARPYGYGRRSLECHCRCSAVTLVSATRASSPAVTVERYCRTTHAVVPARGFSSTASALLVNLSHHSRQDSGPHRGGDFRQDDEASVGRFDRAGLGTMRENAADGDIASAIQPIKDKRRGSFHDANYPAARH